MVPVVTTKGQVVIPSKLRRKHHIKKGTKLYVEDNGNDVPPEKITALFDAAYEFGSSGGKDDRG